LALTDEDWDWALTINFLATVRTTRAALPHLLDRAPATIVTVSLVNAFLPDPAVIGYNAAKGALTNFCKSVSKEFGPRGVRVNTVSPGPVETDLWLGDRGVAATVARATDSHPDQVAKQAVADTSTGRFTHSQEVADLVLLLAGDRAGNVTDVVIDGGLVKTLSPARAQDDYRGHTTGNVHVSEGSGGGGARRELTIPTWTTGDCRGQLTGLAGAAGFVDARGALADRGRRVGLGSGIFGRVGGQRGPAGHRPRAGRRILSPAVGARWVPAHP
jgi:hypothetical protein